MTVILDDSRHTVFSFRYRIPSMDVNPPRKGLPLSSPHRRSCPHRWNRPTYQSMLVGAPWGNNHRPEPDRPWPEGRQVAAENRNVRYPPGCYPEASYPP